MCKLYQHSSTAARRTRVTGGGLRRICDRRSEDGRASLYGDGLVRLRLDGSAADGAPAGPGATSGRASACRQVRRRGPAPAMPPAAAAKPTRKAAPRPARRRRRRPPRRPPRRREEDRQEGGEEEAAKKAAKKSAKKMPGRGPHGGRSGGAKRAVRRAKKAASGAPRKSVRRAKKATRGAKRARQAPPALSRSALGASTGAEPAPPRS